MRDTGNHSSKSIKPSRNPATLSSEPAHSAQDAERGEGSYRGTRDYQASLNAYLETADVEKDARDAAPVDADEASELERAEQAGRKPAIKTDRPPKAK